MPASVIVFICVLFICYCIFMFVRIKFGYLLAVITKGITSLYFIVIGLLCMYHSNAPLAANVLVILGLCFGLAGDVLLDIKHFYFRVEQLMLNLGFLAFGFGHLCYLGAMIIYANYYEVGSLMWPFIIAAIGSIVISVLNYVNTIIFKLNMKGNLIQAGLYLIVLSFVTVFVITLAFISNKFILPAIGFGLFLASDVVLSFIYFGKERNNKIFAIVNHALYYAAQVLIALSILGM